MKILIGFMKYDYGVPERGSSYEYMNIYLPLCDLYNNDNIISFDFYDRLKKVGKKNMNAQFEDFVKETSPDYTIICLFKNEFIPQTLKNIQKYTKSIAYFFDDPWRQDYVKFWIQYFNYFTTSDYYMYQMYKLEKLRNVVYCPFGFNSSLYSKKDLPKIFDVSFVGGYSSYREWLFRYLSKNGIKVNIFGRNWDSKARWLSADQMVDVFNQSKINLNLSNGKFYDIGYFIWALKSPKAMKSIIRTKKHKEQVKGRHFEINACGGFQLSYFIPGLNLYYELEKEIVCFENERNLISLIEFYLNNNSIRNEIAERGYIRSHKDHSAQKYLKKLIDSVSENNYKNM